MIRSCRGFRSDAAHLHRRTWALWHCCLRSYQAPRELLRARGGLAGEMTSLGSWFQAPAARCSVVAPSGGPGQHQHGFTSPSFPLRAGGWQGSGSDNARNAQSLWSSSDVLSACHQTGISRMLLAAPHSCLMVTAQRPPGVLQPERSPSKKSRPAPGPWCPLLTHHKVRASLPPRRGADTNSVPFSSSPGAAP